MSMYLGRKKNCSFQSVSKEKFTDVLNLLLITGGEEKHYALIKDFNSLIYNKTKHKARKSFCMHCFQSQLRHSQQTRD